MKKSPGTAHQHHRGFLLWLIPVLILLTLLIGGGLFVYGVNRALSDGNSAAFHAHALTATEKSQIAAAANSGNKYTYADQFYPCINNPADKCHKTWQYSYYPVGFATTTFITHYVPNTADTLKQIYGTHLVFAGEHVSFQTTSGRHFTIDFPAGALANFSATTKVYNATNPDGGMLVTYRELPSEHSTIIRTDQILGATVGYTPEYIYGIPPQYHIAHGL